MFRKTISYICLMMAGLIGIFSQSVLAESKITAVDTSPFGNAPTGAFEVQVEHDPSLITHTIYRPKTLGKETFPVVVWGEGACENAGLMFPEYLSEIASHGYIVIADGPPVRSRIQRPDQANTAVNTTTDSTTEKPKEASPAVPRPAMSPEPDGTDLIAALDWIEKQNSIASSRFHSAVDMNKVAAMGMSCGGLMTYGASSDPRIDTIGIWNSGLLKPDDKIYNALHSSVIIITGGETDIAYANGKRDFETIPESVPVFYGYYPSVGHFGTYTQDNGGDFGKVAVAWLNYQLKNDESENGKQFFTGEKCSLCSDSKWVINSRNIH